MKKNFLFIQLNAGTSKAWVPETEYSQYVYDVKKRGGFIHPLLGYRIHANQFTLYITAGYQRQKLYYEETLKPNWGWGNPPGKTIVDRQIQRISVQIGFGFH